MRVDICQTSYQKKFNANFRGVDLVRISKQAFPNPKELAEVGKRFDEAIYNKIPGTKDKVATILEFPAFALLARYCNEKNLSMQKMFKTWEISLPEPLENFFSFHILTKDHMSQVTNMFQGNKGIQLSNELSAQVISHRQKIYGINVFKILGGDCRKECEAKAAEAVMKILPKPNGLFEIKSLAELPDIFKKIDF